jgi:hypothetical protein
VSLFPRYRIPWKVSKDATTLVCLAVVGALETHPTFWSKTTWKSAAMGGVPWLAMIAVLRESSRSNGY